MFDGSQTDEDILSVTSRDVSTGRMFNVESGASLQLLSSKAFEIKNNIATTGNGAAIYVAGSLTITGSVSFVNNSAKNGAGLSVATSGSATVTNAVFGGDSTSKCISSGNGGAIYNAGTLTLTGVEIKNSTSGTSHGGAIASSGTLTLVNVNIHVF